MSDSISQLSCGPVDSLTLAETRYRLETFDTNVISSNIEIYYHDLGWCYYLLYGKTKDLSYIRMASNSYDKALSHNPKFAQVLWDQSFFQYTFYKDCQKGKFYMDRYKKVMPKKYWDREQMKLFSIICSK